MQLAFVLAGDKTSKGGAVSLILLNFYLEYKNSYISE
jgi:hypothetical protein